MVADSVGKAEESFGGAGVGPLGPSQREEHDALAWHVCRLVTGRVHVKGCTEQIANLPAQLDILVFSSRSKRSPGVIIKPMLAGLPGHCSASGTIDDLLPASIML